mgnify:FL=1
MTGANFDLLGNNGEDISSKVDLTRFVWVVNPTTIMGIGRSNHPDVKIKKITDNQLTIEFAPNMANFFENGGGFGLTDSIIDKWNLRKGFFTDKNGNIINQIFELEIEILN